MFPPACKKLFGRDETIAKIIRLLEGGAPVCLHGEELSGKSAVMESVLRQLCNKPIGQVCFLSSARNEKGVWQELAFQLCKGIEETKIYSNNTDVNQLAGFVRSEFRNSPHKIFILVDEVNASLPSRTIEALCSLLSLGGIMLIAARSLDANKALVVKLKPIEIGGLTKEDAFQMTEELTAEKVIEDIPFLKRHLYEKTRGLPGLVKKAIDSFSEERITRKMIENVTIQASEKLRYMFVAVSALLITFLMMNKYMSRVSTLQGGRVDYVLGAIGLVIALTFRFIIYPYLRKDK
jgi:hypothetical protein